MKKCKFNKVIRITFNNINSRNCLTDGKTFRVFEMHFDGLAIFLFISKCKNNYKIRPPPRVLL